MSARPRAIALTLAFLTCCGALAFVACSDPNDISTVNVTLREFSVTADQGTVPKGQVTFHVTNGGTVPHEFLVIRTDLAPDQLPTDSDGAVDESSADIEIVDEVEALDPGTSESLTVTLEPGAYVLICNMLDADFGSHYMAGMHTPFTVE